MKPWTAHHLGLTGLVKEGVGDDEVVAIIPNQGASTRPVTALISAAPDLLEAAKLALAYLQKEGFHDGDAYPALLKAITKAEGR